jgi:hypothetical protein
MSGKMARSPVEASPERTSRSAMYRFPNKETIEEVQVNEFFKALLNVGTAGVGSLIALFAKDHLDRGANARKSDTEEFKKIQAIVTDALIATLSSPDFLGGMTKSQFFVQLNDLIHAYEGDRAIIFHNKELNTSFRSLLATTGAFQMEVARLTIPEGEPSRVTTRPRADRIYPSEESTRQSREEASDLDRQSRALATELRTFSDIAKQALRA